MYINICVYMNNMKLQMRLREIKKLEASRKWIEGERLNERDQKI